MNPLNVYTVQYATPQLLTANPFMAAPVLYFCPYGSVASYVQPSVLAATLFGQQQPEAKQSSTDDKMKGDDSGEAEEDERNCGRPEKKKNIRNIIPNIARKILGFISSEDSRRIIMSLFPQLTRSDIMKFYEFTNNIRKSLNFYIGNKDLLRIWYRKSKNSKQAEYYRMIRVLSKYFLNNCCVSSVLLSKRMKPSLKKEHLRYRRKIIDILERGPKAGKSLC